jgi:hypothetical protein
MVPRRLSRSKGTDAYKIREKKLLQAFSLRPNAGSEPLTAVTDFCDLRHGARADWAAIMETMPK